MAARAARRRQPGRRGDGAAATGSDPGSALPWLVALGAYFLFPDYRALGAQIFIAILLSLSLDLILGYAGIITLGHAAFFGAGAYAAGLLAAHGWGEPLSGLVAGGAGRGTARARRAVPSCCAPAA